MGGMRTSAFVPTQQASPAPGGGLGRMGGVIANLLQQPGGVVPPAPGGGLGRNSGVLSSLLAPPVSGANTPTPQQALSGWGAFIQRMQQQPGNRNWDALLQRLRMR